MSRRLVEIAGVLFVFGTLTVALTWPQAAHLRTHVPSFDDSLLSIWRIAWIAHAIGSPASLADANIFHPEARTLAYTDAVLLQGLVATPFIRAGASPVLVYNLLILGSIALSGAAMYLLARRLTGSWPAAFVAGTIFAFVTYRFDHVMHLELQATVFMLLALWFLDRAFEDGRRRDIAGFGVCLVLQLLSSIYYTVFLATALAVAIPVRWLRLTPERQRAFARQLVIVAAIAAICALPYSVSLPPEPDDRRRANGCRRLALLRHAAQLPVVLPRKPGSRFLGRAARVARSDASSQGLRQSGWA